MKAVPSHPKIRTALTIIVPVVLVLIALVILFNHKIWPPGEALGLALGSAIDGGEAQQSVVAQVILTSYRETRTNAAKWSGIYWGFTFLAAIFSAAAGLILKLESLPIDEKRQKDISAVLAVCAALLITISTSGDFQRKWQANRIAAAELERTGYEFLEKRSSDASSILAAVGESLHRRHMAIVGGTGSPSQRGRDSHLETTPLGVHDSRSTAAPSIGLPSTPRSADISGPHALPGEPDDS